MNTMPMGCTMLQREMFMDQLAAMANSIIDGCTPRTAESFSESAFHWAKEFFNSLLHKDNLEKHYLIQEYPVISTTHGCSGYFAVMYWWNPEGFPEPYETGFGRYATEQEAIQEAQQWAIDSDIPYEA